MPKAKTREEREYHEQIAGMRWCALCDALGHAGAQDVHVHHIRDGQGSGQRASHWLVVPLCPSCHQGPMGVHGDRTFMRIAKVEELDLLAATIRRVTRLEGVVG